MLTHLYTTFSFFICFALYNDTGPEFLFLCVSSGEQHSPDPTTFLRKSVICERSHTKTGQIILVVKHVKWEGSLPLSHKDSAEWESLSKILWSSWNTQSLVTGDRAQLLPLGCHDLTQGFPGTDLDVNRKNKIMGIFGVLWNVLSFNLTLSPFLLQGN